MLSKVHKSRAVQNQPGNKIGFNGFKLQGEKFGLPKSVKALSVVLH